MKPLTFTMSEAEKIFFTSDTHFFHKNIIDFCNRPYGDMQTMNSALIMNWNKVVPKDGIVFHAGDFAMTANKEYIKELISQLNGKIYLVFGNHDYQNRLDRVDVKPLFHQTSDMYQFTVLDDELEGGHINFIITHYPFLFWRRGYIHLFGHIHSGPNSTSKDKVPYHPMRYDIGVDAWNYTPVSYNIMKNHIKKMSESL